MSGNGNVLVFDAGGSHIAAGIFNPAAMTLCAIKNLPISNDDSAEELFRVFELLSTSLCVSPESWIGVSVAMPNPFDYDRGVSYMKHKYQRLYGLDMRQELSKRLGCDPTLIHFVNDAAAFLLGELCQGAAKGSSRAVGITLGTGTGSAFAIDSQIVVNGSGVPPNGEIWNFPYRDGTVEDAVSTCALQRLYQRSTGKWEDVREIARLSLNQASARETFKSFGRELGKILRLTCAAFAPERIVLGGGISRAASLFLRETEAEMSDLATSLRVSDRNDESPLIGAGMSWMRKHIPDRVLHDSVADGRHC